MGTIKVKQLAGYSLILGPVIALICYFIQPGGFRYWRTSRSNWRWKGLIMKSVVKDRGFSKGESRHSIV